MDLFRLQLAPMSHIICFQRTFTGVCFYLFHFLFFSFFLSFLSFQCNFFQHARSRFSYAVTVAFGGYVFFSKVIMFPLFVFFLSFFRSKQNHTIIPCLTMVYIINKTKRSRKSRIFIRYKACGVEVDFVGPKPQEAFFHPPLQKDPLFFAKAPTHHPLIVIE